eukprot:6175752-Pleurochrysis_carterae.AAC.2
MTTYPNVCTLGAHFVQMLVMSWCQCGPPSHRPRTLPRRIDSQNFPISASVTYGPIRHWESGDRMASLTQHSPSTHSYAT